jgi:hypothetical protein
MDAYNILVDEPWDFDQGMGDNLITGKILKRGVSSIIFESDKELHLKGCYGNLLLLKSRYDETSLDASDEEPQSVAGALITVSNQEAMQTDEKILESKSKYLIIGALKKSK